MRDHPNNHRSETDMVNIAAMAGMPPKGSGRKTKKSGRKGRKASKGKRY